MGHLNTTLHSANSQNSQTPQWIFNQPRRLDDGFGDYHQMQ